MSEESKEQSYHHMRSAIALLSELGLEPEPQNYAVCYEYVSGLNQDLSKVMDNLIESHRDKRDESIPRRQIEDYYYQYVMRLNEQYLQQIQGDVVKLLANIHASLNTMRGDTERYDATLELHHQQMCRNPAIKTLCTILDQLKEETLGMRYAGERMEGHLSESISDVERLRQDLEQAKREASIDYLTGVANRKGFMEAIEKAVREESLKQQGLCLIVVDIDHFKAFNDRFGHLVGDKVLSFVALTLKKCLRGNDLIARFGGEEFVIMLPATPYTGAMTVAEQLRQAIDSAKLVQSGTRRSLPSIQISAGCARYRIGESIDNFIDRADRAMFASKERGRNRVTGERDLSPTVDGVE